MSDHNVMHSIARLVPEGSRVLDLGCGWGPISLSIATFSPETKVWALQVEQSL